MDVARAKQSFDQSGIQQREEDLGEISAFEPTSVQQEVEEESCFFQADGSDDTRLYYNSEGFVNSFAEIEASLEKDSSSSEASLPNTASLLGKSPSIGRNVFNFFDNEIFSSSITCHTITGLITCSLQHQFSSATKFSS